MVSCMLITTIHKLCRVPFYKTFVFLAELLNVYFKSSFAQLSCAVNFYIFFSSHKKKGKLRILRAAEITLIILKCTNTSCKFNKNANNRSHKEKKTYK